MVKSNSTPNRKSEPASAAARGQLRTRFRRVRGSRQRSLFGIPEIIGLAASAVLLLAAVWAYLLMLTPERARLRDGEAERAKLQLLLRNSREGVKTGENTQATVDEILNSLQDFESAHLSSLRTEGSTALIEELNKLIRANNLRITTGVSFAQFDEMAPNVQQRQQRAPMATGAVKALQNVFPGFGVSLTVEGAYPNLRRFIRDVEAGKQFIVINTVELEGVTDSTAPRIAAAAAAAATTGITPSDGEKTTATGSMLVSLRLDMASYYRRTHELDRNTLSGGETTR